LPLSDITTGVGVYLLLLASWSAFLYIFSRTSGLNLQTSSAEYPIAKSYVPYTAAVDADATEPADPFGLNDATKPVILTTFEALPPAYLIYAEGSDHLPKRVGLKAGRETRIGRSANYSDIVLEDARISRIHAVIQEREDGFYIRDEGSSGGTYVNHQLVNSGEKLLTHGDIINFNAVVYRFELAKYPPSELPPQNFSS